MFCKNYFEDGLSKIHLTSIQDTVSVKDSNSSTYTSGVTVYR